MGLIIFIIIMIIWFLVCTILTIVSTYKIIEGIFQVRKDKDSKDNAFRKILLNVILLLIGIGLFTTFLSVYNDLW